MSQQGRNPVGWTSVGILLGSFIVLLIMVPLAPELLSIRTGTFSVGYWFTLILHALPVAMAYGYLKKRDRDSKRDDS